MSLLSVCATGCGARSGLRSPVVRDVVQRDMPDPVEDSVDVPDFDAPNIDVPNVDVPDVFDAQDTVDVIDVVDVIDSVDVPNRDVPNVDIPDACVPATDRCGAAEVCNNGLDDNCNGAVDEGCRCDPGSVQQCFAGPPGRRNVGICQDGTQVCIGQGMWGECQGGIVPQPEQCNGADNLCTGCSQRMDCEIQCPSGDDPRVPVGAPFTNYMLRGGDFYRGNARSWNWSIQGGPCDQIAPRLVSFDLLDANSQTATFFPRLSGDYTVRLRVVTESGQTRTCVWIVHIEGPGIRVEMCYPESESVDLDLFVHRPGSMTAWYPRPSDVFRPTGDACGWHNCEATIRGMSGIGGGLVPRANWGYPQSPLAECENGPQGAQWRTLRGCSNPRLDIDNNLAEGTGVPENINIDQPNNGEVFRVMVHNFSGQLARPLVNIYCSGRRQATFGAPPDEVRGFEAARMGNSDVGAMWRVADVRAIVNGGRTSCAVTGLRSPGIFGGYLVTFGDPSY